MDEEDGIDIRPSIHVDWACLWDMAVGPLLEGLPVMLSAHATRTAIPPDEWCLQVKKYLGMPPGWRFLVSGNFEDIWFDQSLLEI